MKGSSDQYKILFCDYRIGLKFEGDFVVLEESLHRKLNITVLSISYE